MRRYAEATTVAPEKSRAEIEGLVRKYKGDRFAYGYGTGAGGSVMLCFRIAERMVRFTMAFPDPKEPELAKEISRKYTYGRMSNDVYMARILEQEERRRWRALALVIKAKLEAVATGITTFEEEFMAHIVMPDGKTVGEHVRQAIATAYKTGKTPPMLPAFTS